MHKMWTVGMKHVHKNVAKILRTTTLGGIAYVQVDMIVVQNVFQGKFLPNAYTW